MKGKHKKISKFSIENIYWWSENIKNSNYRIQNIVFRYWGGGDDVIKGKRKKIALFQRKIYV